MKSLVHPTSPFNPFAWLSKVKESASLQIEYLTQQYPESKNKPVDLLSSGYILIL
jgi:hypothetical protein